MSERGGEDRKGKGKAKTSPWEWVAAAVGTLLVLGTIGFMLHAALTRSGSPPAVAVAVDSVVVQESGYLVRIRAENSGGETVASLLVEGELRGDTGTVEKSEATIDYVPAGGKRFAGLFFEEDPRSYALTVRPKGYDRP